jgi:hypothetical protein
VSRLPRVVAKCNREDHARDRDNRRADTHAQQSRTHGEIVPIACSARRRVVRRATTPIVVASAWCRYGSSPMEHRRARGKTRCMKLTPDEVVGGRRVER